MAGRESDAPVVATEPIVDLTAAGGSAAGIPARPEISAQTLGLCLRAWLPRSRSGDSGVLPVLLGIVVVAVAFQIANGKFLSPQNLVTLFEQSSIYMLLAMAEIFALLLGEIDLSVGLIMGLGAVLVAEEVQPAGLTWPWWLAILVALGICAGVGAIQGTLVARLKMPSFIVTLGGLLVLEGVSIIVLGGSLVGIGNSHFSNEVFIYNLFSGHFSPAISWILLAVIGVSAGGWEWYRDSRRRRSGLVAPPASLTALKIIVAAGAGILVVALSNVNRAHFGTIVGLPFIIPIVLVVLATWTLLLQRTRFGRSVSAIGGNPEAARRAGIS